jgi:arylsulfatase A
MHSVALLRRFGLLLVATQIASVLLVYLFHATAAQANESPALKKYPNIVYLLCDDLGVGDLKALNVKSKIPTPALDQLVAQGMRFTDAHSGSAVCTPTRYGILCGRYAWRTKLQSGVLGGLSPSLISANQSTVPKFLKSNGYHSACIGKWHLGLDWKKLEGKSVSELTIESSEQNRNVDYSQPYQAGPLQAGFDEYFGISASLDMVPYVYLKDHAATELPSVDKSFGMRSATHKSHTRLGPAAPDFTAEDVLPRLTSEAIAYLESRSKNRDQPFFLYVPFASPHTPIAPSKDWLGKSGLNPYADFVMEQDDRVGQILKALEKYKLDQDTIVFFTSDNGCSPEADIPKLREMGHDPCHPFRGHKADIYEGGHRVPMIVRWPGVIAPNTTATQTVCLTDLFATVADVIGVPLPAESGPDSFSWLPVFKSPNGPQVRPTTIHHSINGSFAIRKGNHKLCFCSDSGGWSDPRPKPNPDLQAGLQLFDLEQDLQETKNLAKDRPEIVKELAIEMERCIEQGRSTPGAKLANDVQVQLWKRSNRLVSLAKAPHEAAIEALPGMHLLEPAWNSSVVHRESSVLIQLEKDGPITARLAYPASEVLSIESASHAKKFEIGKDFKLGDDKRTLIWLGAPSNEVITAEQMFPPKDAPNSYRHRIGNPDQNLMYFPGRWFHDRDFEVTYVREGFDATSEKSQRPTIPLLPLTMEKLKSGKPLRIAVSGDSISTGLDASGTTQAPPNQPGYPDLVAAQLRKSFGSEVSLTNRAVSGWSIANGVQDLDVLLESSPDLLIVAYGMNDVGRRDPNWFGQQAVTIQERAKAKLPNIEIIWVSTMLGNKEWIHTPRDMFSKYRDELVKRTGPDAVLADLTAVWEELLEHKHDFDLTGNGLNHPNDFGHRLYAQAILQKLSDK